jgi:hypothetical protein
MGHFKVTLITFHARVIRSQIYVLCSLMFLHNNVTA